VDPGTGESKEAKETRVNHAPYVIGGVLVVVLVASLSFWRKHRDPAPLKARMTSNPMPNVGRPCVAKAQAGGSDSAVVSSTVPAEEKSGWAPEPGLQAASP
jgi:hypothetical protein